MNDPILDRYHLQPILAVAAELRLAKCLGGAVRLEDAVQVVVSEIARMETLLSRLAEEAAVIHDALAHREQGKH